MLGKSVLFELFSHTSFEENQSIMKTTLFILLFFPLIVVSQNVVIPDTNFLNALIERGIDLDGDSSISYQEASAAEGFYIPNRNIHSLEGIQAFVNITWFYCDTNHLTEVDLTGLHVLNTFTCSQNQITSLTLPQSQSLIYVNCDNNFLQEIDLTGRNSIAYLSCNINNLLELDVSNLDSLKWLHCSYNQLTQLNVSNHAALESLMCFDNHLTSLNVSGCPKLGAVLCSRNKLVSLDVNQNIQLTHLFCNGNLLTNLDLTQNVNLLSLAVGSSCGTNPMTKLDVSHNTQLIGLMLSNMPDLQEVCVWELPFPTEQVIDLNIGNSPQVFFSLSCLNGVEDVEEIPSNYKVYPNPATESVTIMSMSKKEDLQATLFDVFGNEVRHVQLTSGKANICLTGGMTDGMYFVKISEPTGKVVFTEKVIIRDRE
ncbi:MAG: hypothetical protein CVU05_04255 [Bacteroidetes bacterium HGW-Bacteroidetes-21]|nr:MAG: hypothetical protein CVU05_04255 [Bacteroidetes bacterium HGW-Bacteroidetes-21]